MKFEKFMLPGFYVISHLDDHDLIKKDILDLIELEPLAVKAKNPTQRITKKDWERSKRQSRPWTNIFFPKIEPHLKEIANRVGYGQIVINELWYQQYEQDSMHGWHNHSGNYTGVYYLELKNESPLTEIINPFNQTDMFNVPVIEGSILLFPSYTIHRAPIISNNIRKTIISFNFDWVGIEPELLNNLTNIY
jgi:hypothetical protein